MKSFLAESYDGDKDRRYAGLFLGALLGFLAAVGLGGAIYAIIGAENFEKHIVPALPVVAIVLMALITVSVRRAWKLRRGQLHNPALSRDELLKARSKLRNGVKPPRPVRVSMPDIDLKY